MPLSPSSFSSLDLAALLDWFEQPADVLRSKVLHHGGRFRAPFADRLTPLFHAILCQSAHAVETLLPVSKLNYRLCHTLTCNDELDALMFAALMGNEACLRPLMPALDPNAKSKHGLTALMLAAKEGHLPIVRCLLPLSNPCPLDCENMTALMHAVEANAADCVELLLTHDNVLADSKEVLRAFQLSTLRGHWTCADALALRLPFALAVQGLRQAPLGAVPRFHAHLERQVLECALPPSRPALQQALSESTTPSTGDLALSGTTVQDVSIDAPCSTPEFRAPRRI